MVLARQGKSPVSKSSSFDERPNGKMARSSSQSSLRILPLQSVLQRIELLANVLGLCRLSLVNHLGLSRHTTRKMNTLRILHRDVDI